jgi:hypothetical protein
MVVWTLRELVRRGIQGNVVPRSLIKSGDAISPEVETDLPLDQCFTVFIQTEQKEYRVFWPDGQMLALVEFLNSKTDYFDVLVNENVICPSSSQQHINTSCNHFGYFHHYVNRSTGKEYDILGDPLEALGLNPSLYSIHNHDIIYTGAEGGTAWVDGNTGANPKATDMDGAGADLIAGDTVSLDTKSLEFDLSVAPGTVTVTLGTLTVDAGITLTLGGDLVGKIVTIASTGVLTTSGSNYAYTTTSATNVSGTLTLNGSTVSCTGTGGVNGYSVQTDGGTGVINMGSATVLIGTARFNSSGTITFTSGVCTFNNAIAGNDLVINIASTNTIAHGNGTIAFTFAGAQKLYDSANTARSFYNMTINNASCALTYSPGNSFALTVANNLSIVSGSFTTWDGATSANLTVTAGTTISTGGTLNCKASTCSFGSGTSGSYYALYVAGGTFTGGSGTHTAGSVAIQVGGSLTLTSGTTTIDSIYGGGINTSLTWQAGTFAHGSGTVIFTRAGTQQWDNTMSAAITTYNVTVNNASCNLIPNRLGLIVSNNLTITLGTLNTYTGATSQDLTVTSLTSITGTLTCNASTVSLGSGLVGSYGVSINNGGVLTGGSGAHTFGSIYVYSGGTWTCTSNTTTMNGIGATGNNAGFGATATVTHSSGTISVTYSAGIMDWELNRDIILYNFTVATTTRDVGLYSVTLLRAVTVANNLTITSGSVTLEGSASTTLTVTNATSITGTLTCNASTVSLGSGLHGDGYAVTVNTGGTFTGGTGTNHTIGNILINGGAVTFTTGTTTINGNGGNPTNVSIAFALATGTFDDGNGTTTFTYAGNQYIYVTTGGTTLTLYNLTVNNASCVVSGFGQSGTGNGPALQIDNNLTITLGTLNRLDPTTTTSRNITVTGTSSITGTLTPSTATCTFNGAVTVNNGGTLGGATAWVGAFNAGFTLSAGGTWTPGTSTQTFISTMDIDASVTNAGATIALGTTLDLAASVTWANTTGTTTVRASMTITGASATTSIITSGGTWNWATCSIGLVDIQFDVTTPGTGIVVSFTASWGWDAWTNSATDTLQCTTGDSTGTGNNSKVITSDGILILTGTSGHNVILTGHSRLQGNGNGTTLNLQYLTLASREAGAGYGFTISGSTHTYTNLDNITFQQISANYSFEPYITATDKPTFTNCIFATNTGGASWLNESIVIAVGGTAQLLNCTVPTVGMHSVSGWLLAKDGTGNYTFYGILASSETPDAAYRGSACAGTFTIKNADAYSSSFNSSYTLGAAMPTVTSATVSASTTLALTTYNLTCSAGISNPGILTSTGGDIACTTFSSTGTYTNTSAACVITSTSDVTISGTYTHGSLTTNSMSGTSALNYSVPIYNLTVTANTTTLTTNVSTVAGALTVSGGILTTGATLALVVTGAVSVTGTLTPNASTCTFNGAVTINNGGTMGGATAWNCYAYADFTVSLGGTFSAPASLSFGTRFYFAGDTIDINGTYTHNDGQLVFYKDGAQTIYAGGQTYYDLEVTGYLADSYTTQYESATILDGVGVYTSCIYTISVNSANTVVTMGSASEVGGINNNGASSITRFAPTSSYSVTVQAANIAEYALFNGNNNFDFDYGGSGTTVILKWCYMDIDVTTGGGGVTVSFIGNMSLNGDWTCSAGDTTSCTTTGTTITCNALKDITIAGTIVSTGSAWNNTVTYTGYKSFSVTTTTIQTLTNTTLTGLGTGAAWNDGCDISIGTGARVQQVGTVLTNYVVGMQATSGWYLSKDAASGFLAYGAVPSSEAPSSGWRAADVTSTFSLINASVYGTDFNSSYTLGAAMTSVTNITINASTTFDTSAASSYATTISTSLSLTGTFNANNSALSIASGVTANPSAAFILNGTFNGGTGAHTFGSVNTSGTATMNLTSGNTTINGACGSLAWLSDSGLTLNPSTGTVLFTLAGTQTLGDNNHSAKTFNNLTVSGATMRFYAGLGFNLGCSGNLNVTTGSLTTWDLTTSYNLSVTGNAIIASTLTGKASTSISLGSLTITGTYSATSGTTTITSKDGSNYIYYNNGGTFTHNNGTFTVSTDANGTIRGDSTFYTWAITGLTASRTYTFTAGNTFAVTNYINWLGASAGNELKLRSSTPGTQWFLNISATSEGLLRLDVQDSNAVGNTAIAHASVNSGNNTNWIFFPPPPPGPGFRRSLFSPSLFIPQFFGEQN